MSTGLGVTVFFMVSRIHFKNPRVYPTTYNAVKDDRTPPIKPPNFQLAITNIVKDFSEPEFKKDLDLSTLLSRLAGDTFTSAN